MIASTSLRAFALLVCCAVLTAAANLLLRGSASRASADVALDRWAYATYLLTDIPFLLGVFLYGLAAVVWVGVLSLEELSLSYPVLVSLTFLLVTAGAVVIHRESITPLKIVGMCLMLSGIFVITRE